MRDLSPRQTWPREAVQIGALLTAFALFPGQAYAAQVGCFVTAVFLGMMFVLCLGLTALSKHLLAKHLWKVPRTPWLRLLGLTWLELFIGIFVFALIRTSYWVTVLIYLPAAFLMNKMVLAKVKEAAAGPASFFQRFGIFLIMPFALPVSLQVSGIIWRTLTDMITFTELR